MKRILLKLSGEALAGEGGKGFSHEIVEKVAGQLARLASQGMEVGVVIGGGNFWRGRTGEEIHRIPSDRIGMLATVMNSLYVADVVASQGVRTKIFTAFPCGTFTEPFSTERAVEELSRGTVCFFAGGTGHPFFSTDTGAVLRAAEIGAECLLLAKAIDGVYSADPKLDPSAVRYDRITIDEVLEKGLGVVDLTASVLAKENRIPMLVFALLEEEAIYRAAQGEEGIGTRVEVER